MRRWRVCCVRSVGARAVWGLGAALVFLGGCGATQESELACDRQPPLTYETFGKGFVEQNCTGCHSSYLTSVQDRNYAPLSVNLNTYADVVAWVDRVDARTLVDQDMPPAGGISEDTRALVREWLVCSVYPDAELAGVASLGVQPSHHPTGGRVP